MAWWALNQYTANLYIYLPIYRWVIIVCTRLILSLQTEDEFVYWPSREEAMNCMAFTVTLINKDRLCLSNGEQIIIHDFILEATQVPEWLPLHCPCTPQSFPLYK